MIATIIVMDILLPRMTNVSLLQCVSTALIHTY